jgi:hypothetical protein
MTKAWETKSRERDRQGIETKAISRDNGLDACVPYESRSKKRG